MKKYLKYLITILLIIATILIWVIFNNGINKCSKKEYPIEGVSIIIKEGTLTNTGATFILKNDSDIDVIYGNPYSIEVKKDDKWKKIDVELSFTLPAYTLKAKTSEEITINWEYGYGKLEKGEYRFIKGFSYEKVKDNYVDFSLKVEFNIE